MATFKDVVYNKFDSGTSYIFNNHNFYKLRLWQSSNYIKHQKALAERK